MGQFNINRAQKNLIKNLIETNQNSATAFKNAIDRAQTPEDAEQLKRIAQAFKINIQPHTMETKTTAGARLSVEINANGWLILTEYNKDNSIHRRDSITGEEFATMWEQEQDKRNN